MFTTFFFISAFKVFKYCCHLVADIFAFPGVWNEYDLSHRSSFNQYL